MFAMWGGIEIRVPEDWTVDRAWCRSWAASRTRRGRRKARSNHRLTLRGFVIMGGVEIKN